MAEGTRVPTNQQSDLEIEGDTMKYVMSDIHGDFQNFYKMLVKINFTSYDELYILGDILDKGKENLCLYSFIRDMENIFLIKGNHEFLCERYLSGEISAELWDACGGENTRREVVCLAEKEQEELYNFLNKLPIYAIIRAGKTEYFLTHSGYHADCCVRNQESGIVDIEASVCMAVEWNQEKYLFSDDIHYIPAQLRFDRKIIVGHYPTLLFPEYHRAEIYYGNKYIDIDTGNERRNQGGRLSCLRLDDGKEFYV